MAPDFAKFLADVKRMFPDLSELRFVIEVEPEYAGVVMGSLGVVSVLSTGVVPESTHVVTETFPEGREVWLVKASMFGQGLIVIRECDEAITLM